MKKALYVVGGISVLAALVVAIYLMKSPPTSTSGGGVASVQPQDAKDGSGEVAMATPAPASAPDSTAALPTGSVSVPAASEAQGAEAETAGGGGPGAGGDGTAGLPASSEPAASASPGSASSTSSHALGSSAEDGLILSLYGCSRSSGQTIVVCDADLTNAEAADGFVANATKLWPDVYLVDESGRRHYRSSAFFMNDQGERQLTAQLGDGATKRFLLVFDDVPDDASTVSLKSPNANLDVNEIKISRVSN